MSRAVPAVAAGLKGPTGGVLLVLAAAGLWGTSGIFIKVLTLSAFALTGLRAAIAFLALLPFVRLRAVRLDGTLAVLVSAFAATNLLFALDEALAMFAEEGLDAAFARHDRLAEATRRALAAWGLENVCLDPELYSSALTAVMVPPGADADEIGRASCRERV